ncbi:MAG TPA: sigma-54 dependent transcriptional regulator [Gemmatimonadaceae bacterium]|nr:sigma-54 dependent transcriptional regulator [Gemmatimonadaceae bacterium]
MNRAWNPTDSGRGTGYADPASQDSIAAREKSALRAAPHSQNATISVIVAEEDHALREACATALRQEGYDVTTVARGDEAQTLLRRRAFDIALIHLRMAKVDGLALMRAALLTNPDTLVVMTTGEPSVASNVDVLREGAWDYLPKPFSATHLQLLVGRGAHAVLSRRSTPGLGQVIREVPTDESVTLLGTTPVFRRAVDLAAKVATTDASVFITGESGSGKEMFAHYIHQKSNRAGKPFVAVNCAALPEMLLESEMFGHRKGAFTGAVRDKPGLLEMADGGTLFLDELVEMPKSSQAKLLRVIQDGIVRRVGSEKTDAIVNVRFIAATNGDPEVFVARGDLREDLFYRLRVVRIHLPPLRQRPADIPVLARHFLERFWARHREKGSQPPVFSPAAELALASHAWRGNVRELQNVIENIAVLTEPGKAIEPDDLLMLDEPSEQESPANVALGATSFEEPYHDARDRVLALFETRYLTTLVGRTKGNMSGAARLAGVDRTTLYRLMERHGLQRTPTQGLLSPVAPPATAAQENRGQQAL